MDLSASSVFEWGTMGRPLTYLILEAAFFFMSTLCIDAYGRRGRAVAMPAQLQTLLVRWDCSMLNTSCFSVRQDPSNPRRKLPASTPSIRISACLDDR